MRGLGSEFEKPKRERRLSFDLKPKGDRKTSEAPEHIPMIDEDWKNLTRYKSVKQKIESEYNRYISYRKTALLGVFFGFLLLTITQNKTENNTRVSASSLELFWQKQFMDGKSEMSFSSNEKLMDQLYENLNMIFHLNEFLFSSVPVEEMKVSLRYLNINREDMRWYHIPHISEFGRENVTQVLELPVNLNEPREFKEFFDMFDTLTLTVSDLKICYFKEQVSGCYINMIKIRFIRFGYRFYGRINTRITRVVGKQKMELTDDSDNGHRSTVAAIRSFKKRVSQNLLNRKLGPRAKLLDPDYEPFETPTENLGPKNSDLEAPQADHSDRNRLISVILFAMAFYALYVDLKVAYAIQLDNSLEKHFELKLIIFSQEKILKDNFSTSPPKKISLFLLLSIAKNSLLMYYSLSFSLPEIVKISTSLNDTTQVLAFISIIEILCLKKEIAAILYILSNSIWLFLGSFSGFVAMAAAIILAGNLLINSSTFFQTPSSSFFTFMCLMTGDSIIPIFDSIRSEGWIITIFLTLSLLFFVFALQSLYIMIITDSFMSMMGLDAEGPPEEEEKPQLLPGEKKASLRSVEFMPQIREEKFDPFPDPEEREEFVRRHTLILDSKSDFSERQISRNNSLDAQKGGSPNPLIGSPEPKGSQNNIETLPLNDNSSVYADSREEVQITPPEKIMRLDTTQQNQLFLSRDPRSRMSMHFATKMFSEDNDEVQLFKKAHEDVQAQFKSMMALEMEIFGKIKKLLNASVKVMSNFEKMYVKLCMEFVQVNINKQKTKVLGMRKTI